MSESDPKRDTAALSLAGGCSVAEAADLAGVTPRTVSRWRQDADFAAQVREVRDARLAEAVGILVTASADTAARLLHLALDSKNESVSLGACRSVLAIGNELHSLDELTARVARLEEQIGAI